MLKTTRNLNLLDGGNAVKGCESGASGGSSAAVVAGGALATFAAGVFVLDAGAGGGRFAPARSERASATLPFGGWSSFGGGGGGGGSGCS